MRVRVSDDVGGAKRQSVGWGADRLVDCEVPGDSLDAWLLSWHLGVVMVCLRRIANHDPPRQPDVLAHRNT